MSSTNKTTNLELSQFVGSDKPTWLVDYNGDMSKIDAGVGTVKAQADATDLTVAAHGTAITNLQTTTGEQGTALTGLRTDVDGNTGSINTINSLIGNGTPTTTDKTIIGAINELHADIEGLAPSGSVSADDVAYDNTSSGLTATNVQDAIDEVANAIPGAAATEVQSATIAAGSTQAVLTFTEVIDADTLIDVYTDNFSVVPSSVTYTASTVTIVIPEQTAAVKVAAKVQN